MVLMLVPLTLKTVSAWVSEPLFGRLWVSEGKVGGGEEEEEEEGEWVRRT